MAYKQIYDFFLMRVSQKPASLHYWRRVFPKLDENKIWEKWKVKGNSIDAEDHGFKLRYNKIFTNVILHQLDREVSRECDVCGLEDKDLLHMYVKCTELCEFFDLLKCCLIETLGMVSGVFRWVWP